MPGALSLLIKSRDNIGLRELKEATKQYWAVCLVLPSTRLQPSNQNKEGEMASKVFAEILPQA